MEKSRGEQTTQESDNQIDGRATQQWENDQMESRRGKRPLFFFFFLGLPKSKERRGLLGAEGFVGCVTFC